MKRKSEKNIFVWIILAIAVVVALTEIENKEVKLKEMLLSDGRKEESKFYAGFSLDEEFTGGFGKFDREEEAFELLPDGTEEYQISEEEFETLVGKLEKGKVEVSYDEMME